MRGSNWSRILLLAAAIALLSAACGDTATPTSEVTTAPSPATAPPSTVPPTTTPPTTASPTTAPPTTPPPTTTTTTTPTTTTSITTTTTTTTTTIPAPPGGYVVGTPSLGPPDPLPGSGGASGSGCSPGTTALPDGIWFGIASSSSPDTLVLDLACFYFGDIAYEKGAEVGAEVTNDYFISNVNPTLRSFTVPADLPVHWITTSGELDFAIAPFSEWRTDPDGFVVCPGDSCLVWLYINGGAVTEVMEQYTP